MSRDRRPLRRPPHFIFPPASFGSIKHSATCRLRAIAVLDMTCDIGDKSLSLRLPSIPSLSAVFEQHDRGYAQPGPSINFGAEKKSFSIAMITELFASPKRLTNHELQEALILYCHVFVEVGIKGAFLDERRAVICRHSSFPCAFLNLWIHSTLPNTYEKEFTS